jgi:leucyl aminopeptidase
VPSPLPSLPTALPDVEVAVAARSGLPTAVVSRPPGEEGGPLLGPGGEALSEEWLGSVGVTGKAGEVHLGPPGGARWVVGVGDGTPARWCTAGAALTRAVNARIAAATDTGRPAERTLLVKVPPEAGAAEVAELVRGLRLGGYRFSAATVAPKPRLRTIRLVVTADRKAELPALTAVAGRVAALTEATALARDLANMPSNIKDPAWLAGMAVKAASRVAGLRVAVRDERWLAEQGFGGVLAVGSGSTRPPRLVELSWAPRGARTHLVLVGKGITFDTGGISVKHADGMHLMRTDMAGGAAVISALVAIARLGLGVRVTGLAPCAENHMSGSAYRPGDIVRHYGGRTTEVTNTDAEGRMVLADALAYATRRLRPDLMVDVATLTGSMKVSLGLRTGGLFASEDTLAEHLLAAGERAGELWWRMPLPDDVVSLGAELSDAVVSDVADVRQCPPGPGAISAAAFLQEFTAGLPWAHLDIAGPARSDKAYDDVSPGATGFATRTLVELACSYAS